MDDRFGAENAVCLRVWLADLRAAATIGDAPFLQLAPLLGGLGDEVKMTIGAVLKAVVKANHQRPPKLANGNIDWPQVERVLIQKIEYKNE